MIEPSFLVMSGVKTRGNSKKLWHEGFILDIREKIVAQRNCGISVLEDG